ncbi:MAG TPA: S-methyl-5-thioribose kinase [Lactobacillus acetotolerans]|nr:S-methyl-5-thioribose kinase [Lactobacillus acetotolerans]
MMKSRISPEVVISLVKSKIDFFRNSNDMRCQEIGDGNVNYIFRVTDSKNQSVIVKYADAFIRNSKTRELSTKRSEIEYEILKYQNQVCPDSVPKVYYFDRELPCIIMEDLKDYTIMRTALMEHQIFPLFAEHISKFLYQTLFKTTDLVMPSNDKKEFVGKLINVDMCEISERLVFMEPYKNRQGLNSYHEKNKEFVRRELYQNELLIFEVGKLKNRFKNVAQSMLHGDLHTGSIFINQKDTRIFDPEFSFFGPMGYDIGNIIGNLILSWVPTSLTLGLQQQAYLEWVENTVKDSIDLFVSKYSNYYAQDVIDPMLNNDAFKQHYLQTILSDTSGYAGTEIIRRTVGVAKVKDIQVVDDKIKPLLERTLIRIGQELILNRTQLKSGEAYVDIVSKQLSICKKRGY